MSVAASQVTREEDGGNGAKLIEADHLEVHFPVRSGVLVQRTIGLGLKQTGRLIGALGDPSWNALEDRPRRGPAELWAFSGYAPGQQRRSEANRRAAEQMV